MNATQKAHGRIAPIAAAIAIQLCLGIAYIWSVFQTGVANSIFAGDNAAASLTFSLLLSMLTIGSVIGGKLAAKFSARSTIIAGGVILSLGFFLASLVTPERSYLLWLGYGVLGGTGMGFTYSTTIACAQSWFPEKKGFVTGLIVSALGFGGVVFTPIVESFIHAFGGVEVGEPKTFLVLSGIFLIVCTVGGIFMKNPPQSASKTVSAPDHSKTPSETLRDPRFYLITLTLLLACMGGLMMIGFAKPIAVAKGLGESATLGVLIISMCNSLGRLFWGVASDKLGRKNTVFVLLIGSAVLSMLVNSVEGYFIYVLIGFIGFFYGGILGTFPAFTADLFGSKHMATNYGMVLLGFGAGAVLSSSIAGYYKNVAAENIALMAPAFFIAAACAAAGLACMFVLKALDKKAKPENIAA